MNQKGSTTATIMVVVALLLGGVAGFTAGKGSDNDTKQTSNSVSSKQTDSKAASLRVMLNSIEKEHVALASAATRASFDGSPSFDAAAKATLDNSKELSAAVASVYGADAGTKFNEIFDSHIKFFVDYTVAAKGGDKAGMDKAEQNLNGYVEAISDFLSKANPNLPKEAVNQLFTEHVALLKGTVDAHGAGNHTESYAKQHEAQTQIGTIADALAGAIVKQKPESF